MASTFPGAIDNFTDPLSGSALNSPSHSAQHADLNDAAEKIETYMGLVKVVPTGATNGTVGATGTVTIGSAVSSVTVSGAFSSLYDNYKILVNSTASTQQSIGIRLGSSVTDYNGFLIYGDLGAATVVGFRVIGGSLLPYIGGAAAASQASTASVEILNPFATSYTKFNAGAYMDTGSFGQIHGEHRVATSHTAFTIICATGTITGGTIRVYGYRN